jgi:hypothetical protein
MTFRLVCNTDHRPEGTPPGHLIKGGLETAGEAYRALDHTIYPACDLKVEEENE